MLRVSCDGCGKELQPGKDHHVVKIEVFTARDPAELTEADLDDDHLEAVAELLQQLEQAEDSLSPEPACRNLRYDLCSACRTRYLRDPLGKEQSPPKEAPQKFEFSPN